MPVTCETRPGGQWLGPSSSLAYAYESAGRLDQAIPLFEAVLADAERVLGPNHPLTRTISANLRRARTAGGS
jgi:hypothetical protein